MNFFCRAGPALVYAPISALFVAYNDEVDHTSADVRNCECIVSKDFGHSQKNSLYTGYKKYRMANKWCNSIGELNHRYHYKHKSTQLRY